MERASWALKDRPTFFPGDEGSLARYSGIGVGLISAYTSSHPVFWGINRGLVSWHSRWLCHIYPAMPVAAPLTIGDITSLQPGESIDVALPPFNEKVTYVARGPFIGETEADGSMRFGIFVDL